MSRSSIVVRRADDQPRHTVFDLWIANRVASGSSPEAAARMVADGTVGAALSRPDVACYVAFEDGRPVGYVVLTDHAVSPFADCGCVAVEQLYVAEDVRRRGVGKALLAAVAAHAERHGSDQVATNVPAGGRDLNRYFARLGFAPLTVRRITTTASLHRRLTHEPGSAHSLDKMLARRRSARLRAQQQGMRA